MARRRWRPLRCRSSGAALLIFLILLVTAALTYVVNNLTPEMVEARRARQTSAALALARDALLGHALTYRERQAAQDSDSTGDDDAAMYGYLPMPDMGEAFSRNGDLSNPPCVGEGCATLNQNQINQAYTYIGRFPWKTLGIEPPRDGAGECLWYVVSATHREPRQDTTQPMNWDTPGQLDLVRSDTTPEGLAGHDRPVAIIVSPGAALPGRAASTAIDTQCGGDYTPGGYLELTTLGPPPFNTPVAVGGDTGSQPKPISTKGKIPSGAAFLANDFGLPITGDTLFGAIRNNAYFRTDINALLDRMVSCLRDEIAAGGSLASGKIGGADNNSCYGNDVHPLGYYPNYREMIFVTAPATVNAASCAGALLFAGQRGYGQVRITAAEKATAANYLEGVNLDGFTAGTNGFIGPDLFDRVGTSGQTAAQDIVRCIPAGANLSAVTSPNLSAAQQLVAYDPATHTLTLGKENVTNSTASAAALFGCAWAADEKTLGSGFRGYFQFTFATVGTSVGNTGFVFALIDTESNTVPPCGAAGSHLGYSGDNAVTPKLRSPKIGIEFDQSRNTGFPGNSGENSTNAGRNDPCYTCASGTADTHAAIIYWGHETANAIDAVTLPDGDDNVHGFPGTASLAATRRPPRNPDSEPGIKNINLRTGGQLFHVRVEVTPTRSIDPAAAENSKTSMQTKVWILADGPSVNQIAAMKNTTRPMSLLYPGFQETLSDTGVIFDVAASACTAGVCPPNQTCGTDNICYRQGLRKAKPGFTGSQRTQDQQVTIQNIFTTWLP